MINKEIIINKQTREITNSDLFKLGVDGENLQENIVFKFDDEFVNGTARVEITMQDNTKSYIMTTKQDETYILPIKSIITKKGLNTMQLVITQGTDDEEITIFKSKTFSFYIDPSINAESEAPDEYPQWIDEANTKLNELDNIDIDIEKVNHTATITITKKDGTEEIANIYDGEKGDKGDTGEQGIQGVKGDKGDKGDTGQNATINGVNTLTLTAGKNITLNQSGSTLEISSTGGSGGTSDYTNLSNKPKINNVELSGNKTTSDLGLFSGNYNDLTNKPTIPTIPTNVSAFTNDVGYLTQHQDLSSYATIQYVDNIVGNIEIELEGI